MMRTTANDNGHVPASGSELASLAFKVLFVALLSDVAVVFLSVPSIRPMRWDWMGFQALMGYVLLSATALWASCSLKRGKGRISALLCLGLTGLLMVGAVRMTVLWILGVDRDQDMSQARLIAPMVMHVLLATSYIVAVIAVPWRRIVPVVRVANEGVMAQCGQQSAPIPLYYYPSEARSRHDFVYTSLLLGNAVCFLVSVEAWLRMPFPDDCRWFVRIGVMVAALYSVAMLATVAARLRGLRKAPALTRVINVLLLPLFPIGTALGIYGLLTLDRCIRQGPTDQRRVPQ